MKKYIFSILCTIILIGLLVSCNNSSKDLLSDKMDADDIEKIQIVLAMGNPLYGADSKIIMDSSEISTLVDTFNNAVLGKKIKDDDLAIGFCSYYYFYNGDTLVNKFIFNSNNTNSVLIKRDYYEVTYPEKTPYELYRSSTADTFVVDENLKEMERPDE